MKLTYFFLLLPILNFCHSLIGYDCSGTSNKYLEISLVDIQPCQSTFRNITQKTEFIQIIQPKIFESVNYFQCLVEINHFLFRCGKTIDTLSAGSHYSEYYDVSKEECQQLIKSGTLKYGGIDIHIDKSKNVNSVSIEIIGKIVDQSCYPGNPVTINGIS